MVTRSCLLYFSIGDFIVQSLRQDLGYVSNDEAVAGDSILVPVATAVFDALLVAAIAGSMVMRMPVVEAAASAFSWTLGPIVRKNFL